jgi:predicted dehydrogenase
MHRAIRDVVRSGMLGKVVLIDLQWTIDVTHGAAYFRRWHRHREHSGGLAVHKSSHHFDLVGFWLGDEPTEVVAMGGLHHYRPDSDFRPEQQAGVRCTTCSHQHSCVFQKENDHWRSQAGIDASAGFRHVAEYGINPPDACVFGGDTTVRDTFAVLVGWRSGATLSYSATFAAPYESFRLAISGTRGRLEVSHLIAPKRLRFAPWPTRMLFHPLFGAPQELALPSSVGSHDGGDEALIQALFPRWGAPPSADLATADEGARSVAVGLAAELSMDHGSPVSIRSLLRPSAEWAKALTPEVP